MKTYEIELFDGGCDAGSAVSVGKTKDSTMTTIENIKGLLASHRAESDASAKPLAEALREHGQIVVERGQPNLDYIGLIKFDGDTWLVEQNNAWTRIYDPADASYDYRAELGIE